MLGIKTPSYQATMGFMRDHGQSDGIWAAGQGFEPRYHPPEGCVLPLDDPAIYLILSLQKKVKTLNQRGLNYTKNQAQFQKLFLKRTGLFFLISSQLNRKLLN